MDQNDGTKLVEGKMRKAGISQAAIDAFLFQYRKLLERDTGLIPEDSISAVEQLPRLEDIPGSGFPEELLASTIIFKLNGGLGTSMGLEGAKSLLSIRPGSTFLDVIVRQFLQTRSEHSTELGLYFMNSFNTSAGTKAALAHYPELGDPATLELLQSKAPKIDAKTLLPATWPKNPQLEWCPPGHGDIYPSLLGSGLLKTLLSEGKKFLFVSNSDNLGATLDLRILHYFAESQAPFLMEVTRRTGADRKGGHLARRKRDGRLLLRESAQCREEDESAFQDIKRHRFFNTNNLWIRLEALSDALAACNGFIPLPMIRNQKNIDPRDKTSPKVYQLETAMGAAIECFAGAGAIEVPRSRFAPVKTTGDLLAVRSDAYELDDQWRLVVRPERRGHPPIIRLSDEYRLVDGLEKLIEEGVPSLIRCRSLKVQGPWRFRSGVELAGDVSFVNSTSELRWIEPGKYANCEVR
ncbi:MAG TPA: UTP--glucose-1-phosphate uridylyltransferase [Chthoniobacterales bacterium]|nr:UTP--glucose-1-phosphate uridylyltransferase [Chthoniobacterales bacterium]